MRLHRFERTPRPFFVVPFFLPPVNHVARGCLGTNDSTGGGLSCAESARTGRTPETAIYERKNYGSVRPFVPPFSNKTSTLLTTSLTLTSLAHTPDRISAAALFARPFVSQPPIYDVHPHFLPPVPAVIAVAPPRPSLLLLCPPDSSPVHQW